MKESHTVDDRPVIGIPARVLVESDAKNYAVRSTYASTVAAHGGVPMLLPPCAPSLVERYLRSCDGLLIPGGADVAPDRYGQRAKPHLGEVDEELDAFELELIREAFNQDVPVLAICRGIQSLAVALGGSLFQDLPSELGSQYHEVREHGRQHLAHTISIDQNSKLAGVLGSTSIGVNSFHHQAVQSMPKGIVVAARADDGIVEGVEAPDKRFFIAVQCHPEELWQSAVPDFSRLFQALIDAARRCPALSANSLAPG